MKCPICGYEPPDKQDFVYTGYLSRKCRRCGYKFYINFGVE